MDLQHFPSALSIFDDVEKIQVHQQVEIGEVITGIETANRYELKTPGGRTLLYAAETGSNMITRHCLKSSRPFTMSIIAPGGGEVARFSRPCRCQLCPWTGCCLNSLTVEAPVGIVVGSLQQRAVCLKLQGPVFEVCNENGVPQVLVKGPLCICGKVKFSVTALDGTTQLGVITKEWGGLVKEMFTAADTFSVSFPFRLNQEMKLVLLGACFLIDFMYFEQSH